MRECDAVGQRQALVGGGQPAVGADQSEFDAARRRVYQSAAADTARRTSADHVTVELSVAHVHTVDRSPTRPHSRADAPAFKRGTGRRRCTHNPLRRAYYHLAVCADVEERVRTCLLVQARGHDAAEQVAAHESAEQGRNSAGPGHASSPSEKR